MATKDGSGGYPVMSSAPAADQMSDDIIGCTANLRALAVNRLRSHELSRADVNATLTVSLLAPVVPYSNPCALRLS